jgi:intracellular multiplication protein IcmD
LEVIVSKQRLRSGLLIIKRGLSVLLFTGLFYAGAVLAQSSGDSGIGGLAQNITNEFSKIGALIIAVAFLAGIGFIMAAIFKFKQHKDAPQQVTLGTPIAMLVIGAFLVFLPSLINPAGASIFGGNATAGGFTGQGTSAIKGA